jgi:PIN domain nuclease of toxin-antitoxin system
LDRIEVTHLDTHVVLRLFQGEVSGIGKRARSALEDDDVAISPAVVLELELLHELGRLKATSSRIVAALAEEIGMRVCELPFHVVADYAVKEKWTRDPFDRLIVANARAADATLVTKDEKIQQHYPEAFW